VLVQAERGGTALPAVQNGSRHESDGRDIPVRAIMPGKRSGWRAGMQQWLSREEVGPSTRREVHTGRSSVGRNATLTPLRSGEHPRPAAVREYAAGRRSKSAEPGLLLPAEKTREITAGSSRLASATSSLAALERPMTRTKVQPLVANRADAEQVAAFYSELREAEDVGKRRFEGGIEERTIQRLDRQQTQSRLRRMVGDENVEPLTHPEFLIAVEKLLHEISRVDDEGYDTDEADEARFKIFDRTRQSWHVAREIPPDYAKSPERQSQTPERQKLRSRGSSRQSQRSLGSSQRSQLRSRGSSRKSKSPSQDQEDSDEFTSIEENILQDQARSTRSDGNTSLLRHGTLAIQQFASEDISQAVQHHSVQLAAFATLGIRPDPTCIDLRRRTDAFTSKKLEALAQLFEHVKGLKSPDTLLLSQCQLGAVRLDSMAPHLKRCLTLKRLELNDTNLCSRSSGILAGVLSSLTQLEVLIVDDNPMHARGTKSLMAEARGVESLRGISMKNCQVADEGAHHISQALHPAYWNTNHRDSLVVERRKSLMQFGLNSHAHGAGHPNFFLGTVLTSLNLSDNMIGPTGAVWLLNSLASFGINLEHLDLSLNYITDAGQDLRGATALGGALKTCTKLITLNLNDCKLHAEGGHYLVEGLMAKTKELQQEIKVLWSHIGQSSSENKATLEALERGVEQKEKEFRNYIMSRPLHKLLLARNNLGVHGMTILGEARNLYPSLDELDISSNELTGNSLNFSFDAALVLCSSAKSSRHMQVMSFRDNRIGVEDPDVPDEHPSKQPALKALCDALSKLSSIVRLDLGKNLIGMMGVRQLAAALDVLKHLAFLDLSSNDLGSNGVKIIVAAFRPALEELVLADNNIGPDGTGALATKVPALTKLTKLDLSGNRLTQALTAKRQTGELGATIGGFRLRDVAKDLGTFGEARKQLLMAEARTGGNAAKRGLPALGAACAEHLRRLESMIIYKTIQVGHIRNAKPRLNLSGVDFQPDDITVVFEILAFNKEVTVVDLSWNDLRMRGIAISEWMQDATQLLELNLSNTKIEDQNALAENIADGLKPLINLTTLNLSNNNIGVDGLQFLSFAIKALTSLKILDLSCNPVTRRLQNHTSGDNYYSAGVAKLAESLATCEKLQELNLHKCSLGDEGAIEIAECLQYLSDLRSINLVDNYIDAHGQEVLSKAIRNCRALTNADGITAQEIKAGQHLTFNSIYQVSFVANCIRRDAISKIDLSSNNLGCSEETLRDLCEGLVRLQNLTDLNLSGNKPFSRQVSQTLAHSLKSMTSLRSLNLADNAISGDGGAAILCALVNLFQIEVLDLSKNRFTTFPIALSISCPILWKMELGENPWKWPPPSLMAKNTTQIRDQLNAEFLNGTIDREMALLFIGKSEVGKSRLINALMNEENKAAHIAMDERTHGIQMQIWKPLNSSTSPLYNIYDFAGLDLYLPMQFNMCLLRRAIYCLVWRPFRRMWPEERGKSSPGDKAACVDQETPVYRVGGRGLCTWDDMKPHLGEQVTSFIDKLYRRDTPGFLPGVSILLIATHSDCVDPEDLLRQSQAVKETVEEQVEGLRKKYPYLPPPVLLNGGNPICVSAKTGANVNLLRETLLRETYALPFFGEVLPHSWMKARHDVARIRNLHRAVLRYRKKEADKKENEEREDAQKQPARPLVGTGALGAAPVSNASPANLLPDSEDGSDAEVSSEEKLRSVAKLWNSFAGRCNLRVRLYTENRVRLLPAVLHCSAHASC
jgi:Ran GTPase-activating protein (RanGAP) involved in mRNA processing and transport